MCSRSSAAALLGALLAGAPSGDARAVNLPPTRITENATREWGVRLAGATLYWVGVDPADQDYEIFRFDATRPIDAGTPARCPASNPCQLTQEQFGHDGPWVSEEGAVWMIRSSGRDPVWVARGDAVQQIGWTDEGPASLAAPVIDGKRVVWWGWDASGEPGLFLANLDESFADSAGPCPTTNPCRITSDGLETTHHQPALHGSRVAWSNVPAGGVDSEAFLFDAVLPMDTGPPGPCFETNPCRLTDDEVGQGVVAVSNDLVAWYSCDDATCTEPPVDLLAGGGQPSRTGPVSLSVFDGVDTLVIEDPAPVPDLLSETIVIDGTRVGLAVRVLESGDFGDAIVLDVSRPLVDFDSFPSACPDANPCHLPGALGGLHFIGPFVYSSTGFFGPRDLLRFDPRAPLAPGPPDACPSGNPCTVVEQAEVGARSISRELVGWIACEGPSDEPCRSEIDATEVWVMPEAEGTLLACLVLAARHRRRR